MTWDEFVAKCREVCRAIEDHQFRLAELLFQRFGTKENRRYGDHTIEELAKSCEVSQQYVYRLLALYRDVGEWWSNHRFCPCVILETTLRYFPARESDPAHYLNLWLVRNRPGMRQWEADLRALKGDPDQSEPEDMKPILNTLRKLGRSPTIPSFRKCSDQELHELYVGLVTGSEWSRRIENVFRDRLKRGTWQAEQLPSKKELKQQLKKGMDSKNRYHEHHDMDTPTGDDEVCREYASPPVPAVASEYDHCLITHDNDVLPLGAHEPVTPPEKIREGA